MEYVVQAIKILRKLVNAQTNARCPKTGFYAASLNRTRFFGVFTNPRELACKFCILIYAIIGTCIKLISNHEKIKENGAKSGFWTSRVSLSVHQIS